MDRTTFVIASIRRANLEHLLTNLHELVAKGRIAKKNEYLRCAFAHSNSGAPQQRLILANGLMCYRVHTLTHSFKRVRIALKRGSFVVAIKVYGAISREMPSEPKTRQT